MEKDKKNKKIIIITSVIIIILILIVTFLVVLLNGKNEGYDKNIIENLTKENVVKNDTISKNDNIVIKDDPTEKLNRKYGKVEIVWIDQNNNIIDEPLKPYLGGLTPVKFNTKTNLFEQTSQSDESWYNYNEQKWANAMAEDGSYFVWIPRYAYRIVYYSNAQYEKVIGYCDGRGITKLNSDETLTRISANNTGIREISNHYIVQSAFSKDTASRI